MTEKLKRDPPSTTNRRRARANARGTGNLRLCMCEMRFDMCSGEVIFALDVYLYINIYICIHIHWQAEAFIRASVVRFFLRPAPRHPSFFRAILCPSPSRPSAYTPSLIRPVCVHDVWAPLENCRGKTHFRIFLLYTQSAVHTHTHTHSHRHSPPTRMRASVCERAYVCERVRARVCVRRSFPSFLSVIPFRR